MIELLGRSDFDGLGFFGTISSEDVSSLSCEPDLKLYLHNKKEVAQFCGPEGWIVRAVPAGTFLTNLLYDDTVNSVLRWMKEESEEVLLSILEDIDDEDRWKPLDNIMAEIISAEKKLPLLVLLEKEFRMCRQLKMRRVDGGMYQADCLKNIANTWKAVRERIRYIFQTFCDGENKEGLRSFAYVSSAVRWLEFHYKTVFSAVVPAEGGEGAFCQVLQPKTIEDAADFLLSCCVKNNASFKICDCCGRYFVTTYSNVKYCGRQGNGEDNACRQVAPKIQFNKKVKDDPIQSLFTKVYRTMYSRVSSGAMDKQLFKEWSRKARQLRDDCIAGKITIEGYADWLGEYLGRNPLY